MPRQERPLDPDGGPLAGWAADLRALRATAGNPGYRELARRAHFSPSTLSDAASGQRLPSLAVALGYVRACGGDIDSWEARWRTLSAELAFNASQFAPADGGASPYRGLATFQAEDAEWFFGRTDLVRELTTRIAAHRFVAVFGPSGSGKSSLLRAGVLPALACPDTDRPAWPAIVCTPGDRPLAECAIHVARLLRLPAGNILPDLARDPLNLHLAVRQALVDAPDDVDLVLVIDQFEELFTVCADRPQRAGFIAALTAAVRAPGSRLRVVLGVRADFYGRCAEHTDLVEALRDNQILIGAMAQADLRCAITEPARRAGLTVEATLVSTILSEMTGRPGALPMMSHALLETWRRRRGTTLSLAGYEMTGGIDGAIQQTAEATYTSLDTDQQHVAREILLRLANPGENAPDTGRRAALAEIGADAGTTDVLEILAAARLITLDEDTAEVAHEALIHAWPRLRAWLDEDRDDLRIHRHLTDATHTWQRLGRDQGALYRGVQLSTAQDWYARRCPTLNPREREFLDASIAARTAEHRDRRRRTRRLRVLVATAVILLGLTAATGAVALSQRQQARAQQALLLSHTLAARAMGLGSEQENQSRLLAVLAYQQASTVEARSAVLAEQTPKLVTRLASSNRSPVQTVAVSADGHTVALGNADGTTTVCGGPTSLWDMSADTSPFTGTDFAECADTPWARAGVPPTTLPGNGILVTAMSLTGDGHTLAVGHADGTMTLWHLGGGHQNNATPVGELTHINDFPELGGPMESVNAVALTPHGQVMVVRNSPGVTFMCESPVTLTVRADTGCPTTFWVGGEPTNGAPVGYLVYVLATSADGRVLVVGRSDGVVTLWNLAAQQTIATFVQPGLPTAVALSPDGHTLAVDASGTVHLWDIPSHNEIANFQVSATSAGGLAFSADGRTLLVATANGVALWDIDANRVAAKMCDNIPILTRDQWARLIPELPFHWPCRDN